VVLITHDRYLMDRLSDRLLYLDGEGGAGYFADYPQWLQSRASRSPATGKDAAAPAQKQPAVQRLSREERKELDGIQKKVERVEAEVARLQQQMLDPAVVSDAARLKQLHAEVQAAEARVAQIYARWEELETKAAGG
jgi:ATP-binding cassette subfamily F protein uup